MSVTDAAILGGLLVLSKGLGNMKKAHERERKRGAEISRRAADPITLDKGVAPGVSGAQPAPQSLRGMYAGLGASQRSTRDHHMIRGLIQSKSPQLDVNERLSRIQKQEGYGQTNKTARMIHMFGQGRAHNVGNDYKPITAQLAGNTSVSSGMMSNVHQSMKKYYNMDPNKDYSPETEPEDMGISMRNVDVSKADPMYPHGPGQKRGRVYNHPFLGNNTIIKANHYEPRLPTEKTFAFQKAKNYREFLNVTTHSAGTPSIHGRPSQKTEGQIYL